MRIISALFLLLILSGCATITRGTQEAFAIESNPPGATAKLSTGLTCQTPCSIKVKRRGDFTVKIEKEGYETVEATVTSSIDGAGGAGMAGNVILGGLIGAGVDAGTGAMHSHKPNPLSVTMVKLGEATKSDSKVQVGSQSELDPLSMTAGGDAQEVAVDSMPQDDGEDDVNPLDMGAEDEEE
jgi:hypothetical protein